MRILLALLTLVAPAPSQAPPAGAPPSDDDAEASLPLGNWALVSNGQMWQFRVHDVDPDGAITLSMAAAADGSPWVSIDDATWDAEAHRLTFSRVIQGTTRQRYTGYLHDDAGQSNMHFLSGTFTHEGPAADTARPAYGWMAVLE